MQLETIVLQKPELETDSGQKTLKVCTERLGSNKYFIRQEERKIKAFSLNSG